MIDMSKYIGELTKILVETALSTNTPIGYNTCCLLATKVAGDIFDEIQSEIWAAYKSNYDARESRRNKYPQDYDPFFMGLLQGKMDALRGISEFIDDELKKKYMPSTARGRWVQQKAKALDRKWFNCSICGFCVSEHDLSRRCEHCGAEMEDCAE